MKGTISIIIAPEPDDAVETRLVGEQIHLAIGGVAGPTLILRTPQAAAGLARACLAAFNALRQQRIAQEILEPFAGELPKMVTRAEVDEAAPAEPTTDDPF